MIKAYTLNERGKIELTVDELQKLLEEAEAEGKRLAGQPSISYQCPLNTITRPKTTITSGDPLPISHFTCQSVSSSTTEAAAPNAGAQSAQKVLRGICECFGIKSEG